MGFDRDEEAQLRFRNAALEELLKQSKERNYANIRQVLDQVNQHYLDAQTAYSTKQTTLNLEVRNYYFTILWEYIVSFFYHWAFSSPQSPTQLNLEQQKADLENWLETETNTYTQQAHSLYEISAEIEQLKNNIARMESELAATESIIQGIDQDIHAATRDTSRHHEERLVKTDMLATHIQQRDLLTKDIIQLYRNIDAQMSKLMTLSSLPAASPETESYVTDKVNKEQHIQSLLNICAAINHPVAVALQTVLRNRTDVSVAALRVELLKHPDYLEHHLLADAVWSGSVYFPHITQDMDRGIAVMALVHAHEEKLAGIKARMELLDSGYRVKPHKDILQQLESAQSHKQSLSQSIHAALLANEAATPDPESPIHLKLEEIAESRIQDDKLQRLQTLCARISHPIAKELQHYLRYQTTVSLQAVGVALNKMGATQNDPALVNLLWEAGQLFPQIQKLDTNNPKQRMVTRIAELDEQLTMGRGMRRSFEEELADMKTQLIESFDAEIMSPQELEEQLAQVRQDLMVVNDEIAQSSQDPELYELRRDLEVEVRRLDGQIRNFATETAGLRTMQGTIQGLTETAYLPKAKRRMLKDNYPQQYEHYREYIQMVNAIKPQRKILEQSILSLEAERATHVRALEQFSAPKSSHAGQSYTDFFRAQLSGGHAAVKKPNPDPKSPNEDQDTPKYH